MFGFRKGYVTCVMPTSVHTDLLFGAIDCFLSQTYGKKHLYIVEYGSLEHFKIVSEWIMRNVKDKSIVTLFKVGGMETKGQAMNFAFAHCTDEYIALFEDNSYFGKERLERQVVALDGSGLSYSLLDKCLIKNNTDIDFDGGVNSSLLIQNHLLLGTEIKFGDDGSEFSKFYDDIRANYKRIVVPNNGIEYSIDLSGLTLRDEKAFFRSLLECNEKKQMREKIEKYLNNV